VSELERKQPPWLLSIHIGQPLANPYFNYCLQTLKMSCTISMAVLESGGLERGYEIDS